MGEARKLHQILVNLLTNAIKYSEPGTEIIISVHSEPSAVRFEVSDQGVGIRREHMPRLFEKFYRADDPAVRRTSGTGLGLYIVRSLVPCWAARSMSGAGTVRVRSLSSRCPAQKQPPGPERGWPRWRTECPPRRRSSSSTTRP